MSSKENTRTHLECRRIYRTNGWVSAINNGLGKKREYYSCLEVLGEEAEH
jgi:hypothetical protein